jgi:hypothetical protein
MKKRFLLITTALVLLAAAAFPAFAEDEEEYKGDFDYNGVIDSESGYGDGSAAASADGRVTITTSMLYDRDRAMFVFPLQGTDEVLCSAADGMIVTEPVTLRVSGSSALQVYRSGEPFDMTGLNEIEQIGEYIVYAGADSGDRICSFTIVGSATSVIHRYEMPENFVIRNATLDGSVTDYSRYYVDMEKEGSYRVDYSCTTTNQDYTLVTQIDRTPPKLVLSGSVGSDGRVHSAVRFSGLEPDDTLYVELDGKPYNVEISNGSGTLKNTGVYHVVATDKAGNSESREFTIMVYLDSNGVLFILLVIAALAAVVVYAVFKRRTLKIR